MGHKPSAPTYDTNAAREEQNRLNQAAGLQKYSNVNSPLGGYSVSVDPETGKMTVNKALSDNSTKAQNAQLATMQYYGNPSQAEQAYYNAQIAYLQPQMDRQVARTESGLTNRGLALGSSAWNEATGDVYDTQNKTLTNLSNDAVNAGQGYQSNMLGSASMLGNQVYDPQMVGGANGAGLYNAYDKQYQNAVDVYKTKLSDYNSLQSALFPSVGSILGGIGGAAIASNSNGNQPANGTYVTDIYGNVVGQVGGYSGMGYVGK